jgi:tRNA threonylcarbamoyladenosine biosynthesis protein TsaE
MEETVALGEAIAAYVRAGDLLALIGELGAGKTQFVRGLANGMGVERNVVVSPTFVIAQEYVPHQADHPRLIHIDAYRIQKLDELESIGWEITGDVLGGELRENSVVAIEWADRLDELVGHDRLEVRLSHAPGGLDEREVELVAHGIWRERFGAMEAGLGRVRCAAPPFEEPGRRPVRTADPTPCPICGKPVATGEERFPFCSKRCKTIDLGKWISGNYVISRPIDQSDLDEV